MKGFRYCGKCCWDQRVDWSSCRLLQAGTQHLHTPKACLKPRTRQSPLILWTWKRMKGEKDSVGVHWGLCSWPLLKALSREQTALCFVLFSGVFFFLCFNFNFNSLIPNHFEVGRWEFFFCFPLFCVCLFFFLAVLCMFLFLLACRSVDLLID